MHVGFQVGLDLHLLKVGYRRVAIGDADSPAAHRQLKAIRELKSPQCLLTYAHSSSVAVTGT